MQMQIHQNPPEILFNYPNIIQKRNCPGDNLQMFLFKAVGLLKSEGDGESLTQISSWHLDMGIAA